MGISRKISHPSGVTTKVLDVPWHPLESSYLNDIAFILILLHANLFQRSPGLWASDCQEPPPRYTSRPGQTLGSLESPKQPRKYRVCITDISECRNPVSSNCWPQHLFVKQKFRTIEETRAAAGHEAAAVKEDHHRQQGFVSHNVLGNVSHNVTPFLGSVANLFLGKGWRVDVQMESIFCSLSEGKNSCKG